MKSDFIAISAYCGEKSLSLPKDFDIGELISKSEDGDVKVTGYKFKRTLLDKLVPLLGLKKIDRTKISNKKIIKLFRISESNNMMVILKDSKFGVSHKRIGNIIESDLIEQTIVCEDDRIFDTISFLNEIYSDSISSKEMKKEIGISRLKYEVFYLSSQIRSLIEQLQ